MSAIYADIDQTGYLITGLLIHQQSLFAQNMRNGMFTRPVCLLPPSDAYDLTCFASPNSRIRRAAKTYYSQSDYLSEGQELVGSWGGEGAKRLGLDGIVDKNPSTGCATILIQKPASQLTVRTRSDRTVGYDFTFSVPKSRVACLCPHRRPRAADRLPRGGR